MIKFEKHCISPHANYFKFDMASYFFMLRLK